MPRASQADISMRYFPDVSDISLQVPMSQDNLLTEDQPDDLVYDAFDDSEGFDADPFTTPLPKSSHHAPLTLSEITPRGEKINSAPTAGGPSRGASENTNAERQEKESSVRSVILKKGSVDDMFERRKRDSYQQMGIDLTSKSTARLRRAPAESTGAQETHANTAIRPKPIEATRGVAKAGPARGDGTKHKGKRPILGEHAGIVKHKPRVPSSSSTQTNPSKPILKPKSILKPPKAASTLPSSTLSRTMTALSQTPKAERPKWGDVVAEVQNASQGKRDRTSGIGIMGGGLIDVLVMYGEKLKGSLGFSSSGNTPASSSDVSQTKLPESLHFVTHDPAEKRIHHAPNIPGPSSKPLTLSDLTPSKSDKTNQDDLLTLSQLSPARQPPAPSDIYEEFGGDDRPRLGTSPMRPSKKRASTASPRSKRKKGKLDPYPHTERSESSKAVGGRVAKTVSKPRALGPSHATNVAPKDVKPLQQRAQASSRSDVDVPLKSHPRTISSRDLKGKRVEHAGAKLQDRRVAGKERPASSTLAVPVGPAFASDIYRQRALEKVQREREGREEQERQKRSFKAGAMPYFPKPPPPARPAVRTTVPTAFTFQSDARAAQRNVEFEEKRKTWESRATRHALPMPDFAAMHAAQAEAEAARGRRAAPVRPTEAPALTTMVRAKEREKFEEERRAREKAAERLREMRQRERDEQEERAYREARKRTVPKAHEVPEWYKDVPKRRDVE